MTDKYNYEAVQMAFCHHQRAQTWDSVSVDSLTLLIHYQQLNTLIVKPIRDEDGYIYDYETPVNTHVGVKMTHQFLTNWQNG